jgi:transcriptional regulator with XRE-family HTH domain
MTDIYELTDLRNLVARAKSAGVTKREMAESIGISPSGLSNALKGVSRLTPAAWSLLNITLRQSARDGMEKAPLGYE